MHVHVHTQTTLVSIFLLRWNLVSKCNLSKRLDFNLLALLWSKIYLCWRYLSASLLHFLLNTIRETREIWTKIEGLEKGLDDEKKISPLGNPKDFFFSSKKINYLGTSQAQKKRGATSDLLKQNSTH